MKFIMTEHAVEMQAETEFDRDVCEKLLRYRHGAVIREGMTTDSQYPPALRLTNVKLMLSDLPAW